MGSAVQTYSKATDSARVTLVIPGKLWEDVKRLVPVGRRSQLVAEALAAEVDRRQQQAFLSDIQEFQEYLFEKYGEMPDSADDINVMREKRDAEIAAMR